MATWPTRVWRDGAEGGDPGCRLSPGRCTASASWPIFFTPAPLEQLDAPISFEGSRWTGFSGIDSARGRSSHGDAQETCAQAVQSQRLSGGPDEGRQVIALAVHPGIAPTGLQRYMGPAGNVLNAASQSAGFSAARAASRVLFAALSLDFNDAQGAYIVDNKTVLGSKCSRDEALQRALWELSLENTSGIATLDENCDHGTVV
ncbi:hypothetical protein CYMTET_29682 [Cymbomonas tetramitiformis]|uniref:Uncharacterized protein n=1 Tax=Cymbomonas tetramitiformis TaxID=36881 RepID=A0AAE0KUX2_9CHLO|nr:hypothetical protein CYMTET_29682 [Cymbomonas tetramitiformis]